MNYEIREIRPGEAEDGRVAGGAFLVIVEAGEKKVSCIDIIFVLPQYRGSGVAKQLYHSSVENLHQRCWL